MTAPDFDAARDGQPQGSRRDADRDRQAKSHLRDEERHIGSPRDGSRLVYVMGASGSGKDTLLRLARTRLDGADRVLVAHRYITRPAGADEASIFLDPAEHARRAALGCFALHWASHKLAYGIGVEIDAWMAAGITVLVNGSRAYLPQACARYPGLCAVTIRVNTETLQRRLANRGRESAEDIAARLARADASFDVPADCEMVALDNNGAADDAAAELLAIARRRCHA
ncbi:MULTISPECIES: phosphonate metabolism protein/1,5-bisphosphokinase (PRPP-forming) PhnN [unclassified Achromobacter]|uniref:phosphonate metabolism protein/1,5-bisphosphokinase (PRPP-forming) PhnN n=1 Tax=unclassified Achromobacter TaxID=2626865 RepID=UPI000B51D8FB|nr:MULTISPECIES: phosphonate metabolism protein/1,5-bisphosphokinase (PRPP-forming) PhnN [unclassified Achromobacter]OWT75316.1 phosphonate metabolism protein/1,5-bisphosphokinase (PRPP-forming) PhnN [Achromobacter sp. HZ28]OWT75976.1 phosphonate metabolism protein/1,5-bisphosphokinase (PRPP-forming) PhnN [Achromobacter sp. HZ34]